MSRLAVCLFFIAILHTGIITFSRANETSTDSISKNDVETTTKPTEIEPVKDSEVPSKVEADEKSEVSSKAEPKVEADEKIGISSKAEPKVEETSVGPEKKDDKPKEKDAKDNESKKADVTEKTVSSDNRNILSDLVKGAPVEHTNVLFEFPKNILGPINAAGAKIGDVVSKGIDTAKDLAGGTFNFLRTSATSLFEK